MPYVQRNSSNAIVGVFAQPQYDAHEWNEPQDQWVPIATEYLADDNAELLAYLNPPDNLPDLQPFQFRAMLAISGHAGALDAYIASLPDPQKTIAQAKLDYSLTFQRKNELVLAAQQALGLTDDQLNALWAQAQAIT